MYDNIVICDDNKPYSRKLYRYLSEHNPGGKNSVFLIHSPDKLKSLEQERPIDTLLLSDSLYTNTEQADSLPGSRKFLLTTSPASPDMYDTLIPFEPIHRFQRADALSKIIFFQKPDRSPPNVPMDTPADSLPKTCPTGLIGFYSPVHRVGQTAQALAMAHKCTTNGSVLYLNLREYPEYHLLPGEFPTDKRRNLGDLLFTHTQDKDRLCVEISAMAVYHNGFSVIMPIPVIEDLKTVPQQRWGTLIRSIRQLDAFETIILDLGDCVNGLYHILDLCEHIYTHYTSDLYALSKLKIYEHNLVTMGLEHILNKTIRQQVIP